MHFWIIVNFCDCTIIKNVVYSYRVEVTFPCDVEIWADINSSNCAVVDCDDLSQWEVMMAKYLRSIALLAMLTANDNII